MSLDTHSNNMNDVCMQVRWRGPEGEDTMLQVCVLQLSHSKHLVLKSNLYVSVVPTGVASNPAFSLLLFITPNQCLLTETVCSLNLTLPETFHLNLQFLHYCSGGSIVLSVSAGSPTARSRSAGETR